MSKFPKTRNTLLDDSSLDFSDSPKALNGSNGFHALNDTDHHVNEEYEYDAYTPDSCFGSDDIWLVYEIEHQKMALAGLRQSKSFEPFKYDQAYIKLNYYRWLGNNLDEFFKIEKEVKQQFKKLPDAEVINAKVKNKIDEEVKKRQEAGFYQFAIYLVQKDIEKMRKMGASYKRQYETAKIKFKYLKFVFDHRNANDEAAEYCKILCQKISNSETISTIYFSDNIPKDFIEPYEAMREEIQFYRFRHPIPSEPMKVDQNHVRTQIKEQRDEIQKLKAPLLNKADGNVSGEPEINLSLLIDALKLESCDYQEALSGYEARVRETSKQGVVNNPDYEWQKIVLEYLHFTFKNRKESVDTVKYCEKLCRKILKGEAPSFYDFLNPPVNFSKAFERMKIKKQLCEYRCIVRDLEQKLRAREGLFKFSSGVTCELAKIQLKYLKRVSHPKNYEKNAAEVIAYGEQLLTAIEAGQSFPAPDSSTGFLAHYNEMNKELNQLRENQRSAIDDVLSFYGEYNKVESYALNFIVNEKLADKDLKPGNIYVFKEEFQVKVKSLSGEVAEIKENYSFNDIIGCDEVRKQINELSSSSYNVKNKHQKFIDDCMNRAPNLNKEIRKTTVGERTLLIARKWSKGRLYTGNYAQHENLIRLVERFALLQASSVTALGGAFNEKEDFTTPKKIQEFIDQKDLTDQDKIQKFIDQAYKSFSDLQNELVGRISIKAQAIFDNLPLEYFKDITFLGSDHRQSIKNNHQKTILSYLKGEINHKDPRFTKVLKAAKEPKKLRLHLRLAKAELKKEKFGYDLELKKLKKDLHHVCEEYGFASHLEVKKSKNLAKATYEFHADGKAVVSPEKQNNRRKKAENEKLSKSLGLLSMVVNAPSATRTITYGLATITKAVQFIFGVRKVDDPLEPVSPKMVLAGVLKAVPFLINVGVRVITSPVVVVDWMVKKICGHQYSFINPMRPYYEGGFDWIYRKIDNVVGRKAASSHITPRTLTQRATAEQQAVASGVMAIATAANSGAGQGFYAGAAQLPSNPANIMAIDAVKGVTAAVTSGGNSFANNNSAYQKDAKAKSIPTQSVETRVKGADHSSKPSLAGFFAKKNVAAVDAPHRIAEQAIVIQQNI